MTPGRPGGRGFESLRERIVGFVQVHRGIDQVADRRAHTPEAVGSNPTPATSLGWWNLPVDTLAREASGLRGPCEFDPRPEHHTHALVVEPPVDTPASEAGARDEHASSTLARGTATSRWLERETRRAQNAVPSRACGFDSRPGQRWRVNRRGAGAGLNPVGTDTVWGSRPPPSASLRARRRSSARASGR